MVFLTGNSLYYKYILLLFTKSQPYDYGSVMHYSKKAFTKNGMLTIVPKPNPNVELGQRIGLSDIDKQELLAVYK